MCGSRMEVTAEGTAAAAAPSFCSGVGRMADMSLYLDFFPKKRIKAEGLDL